MPPLPPRAPVVPPPVASQSAPASAPVATAPPEPSKPTKPPKPKKPPEFGFHCFLCGSLLHARPDQIGKTINCHDCHSVNEVRAPIDRVNSADRPTLVGAQDFQMSDPGQRPKFASLEQRRPGDEEEEEEEDFRVAPDPEPPPLPAGTMAGGPPPAPDDGLIDVFALHGSSSAPPPVSSPPPSQSGSPAPYIPGNFKPDFRLGPNAEPVPGRPPSVSSSASSSSPVTSAPPKYDPATGTYVPVIPAGPKGPRVRRHEESYGDELWSGTTDPDRPAYMRSPFMVGVVEFLFYPGTIGRWLCLTALALIPISMIELSIGTGGGFAGVASGTLAVITGVAWAVIFAVHLQSIVRDTGRGCDAIEKWPIVGIFPRGNPLYLAGSLAIAAAPGLMLWILYYVSSEGFSVRGFMILLTSIMFFLPPLWLPILMHKSVVGAHQSPAFLESFRHSGDGWIVFGMQTLLLAFIAGIGISIWSFGSPIAAPFSAVLIVTPLLLYARLLGRMLWYIDPAMTPPPRPPKMAPVPLPETVDPSQIRRG